MEKCIGRQGIESECWKNLDNGERNGRKCFEQKRALRNMRVKSWI